LQKTTLLGLQKRLGEKKIFFQKKKKKKKICWGCKNSAGVCRNSAGVAKMTWRKKKIFFKKTLLGLQMCHFWGWGRRPG